jgi:hypothetical protein
MATEQGHGAVRRAADRRAGAGGHRGLADDGTTSGRSRTGSDVGSGRSSCSPPQPDCDRANGSRSNCATSTASRASFTFAAHTATAGSNAPRLTPASAPSRSRRSRSRRSTPYQDATAPRSCPCPARRLPRPTQLPLPRLEARPARAWDRPGSKDLRFEAFLCHVRAPRRHLDLRPIPLHGRQLDDDRPPPPLRPARCNSP